MVPRFFTSSSCVMPMPVSSMVRVPALGVGDDADLERGLLPEQLGLGHGAEAQLVQRVGRVGDQLAQEDLLVAIERVDDQVEQLIDLSLERMGLPLAVSTDMVPPDA